MNPRRPVLPRVTLPLFGLLCAVPAAQAQSGRDYRTVSNSRQFLGEQSLDVQVRFGLGHFNLTRDQSGALYRSTLVYDEEMFDPEFDYDADETRLRVDLAREDTGRRNINLRELRDLRQRLDLSLSPTVPTRVNLELGVVRADIDLGGMRLTEATVKTGASESVIRFSRPTVAPCERLHIAMGAAEFSAERLGNSNCAEMSFQGAAGAFALDFSGEWQHVGETAARIKMGFGTLKLVLPEHLGVVVSLDRLLASFDRSGFVKQGDEYFSSNYDSAATKLHLDIDATIGDIEVVWVPR